MPHHKFDIRRNGESLYSYRGICAAGVINELHKRLRAGEEFMLVISSYSRPVNDDGLRASMSSHARFVSGDDRWAYDSSA